MASIFHERGCKVSLLVLVSLLTIAHPAFSRDCGALAYKAEIEKTEALVVSRAPMKGTVGEYPTKNGTKECVRFDFSITPWGSPFRISISDTSNNTAFEIEAAKALAQYKFNGKLFGFMGGYSLVFYGVDNKMPEGYRVVK